MFTCFFQFMPHVHTTVLDLVKQKFINSRDMPNEPEFIYFLWASAYS